MAYRIHDLLIFPLKSGAGVRVDQMVCEPRGPRFDRRWMVVDANGKFVTQRTHPELARVVIDISEGEVTARLGDQRVLLEQPAGPGTVDVTVWNSDLSACDLGEEVARTFSEFLGSHVRVVFMSDTDVRLANPERAPNQLVSFADGYPYLITNTASLDDLNRRAQTSLPMSRFRANIVISGASPWEEDSWEQLKVGDVSLRLVKPCARCSMTTVDQQAGVFVGPEPLQTLATFRREPDGVMFGWNAVGPKSGTIRVGDEASVIIR